MIAKRNISQKKKKKKKVNSASGILDTLMFFSDITLRIEEYHVVFTLAI